MSRTRRLLHPKRPRLLARDRYNMMPNEVATAGTDSPSSLLYALEALHRDPPIPRDEGSGAAWTVPGWCTRVKRRGSMRRRGCPPDLLAAPWAPLLASDILPRLDGA
jgi:hypothetical protein